MAITTSVIVHDSAQASGKRRITELHTWHDGVVDNHHYNAPAGHDADAAMAVRVVKWNARAIAEERRRVERSIAGGQGPADVLARLRHNTPRQVLRAFLKGFMKIEDAEQAIRVAKFIRDNVTNADLTAEVGAAARQKVRARALSLIAMETDWLAAKADEVEL